MCLISATAYRLQFSDQMEKTDRRLCAESVLARRKTPLYRIAINFRSILFLLVDFFHPHHFNHSVQSKRTDSDGKWIFIPPHMHRIHNGHFCCFTEILILVFFSLPPNDMAAF